MQAAARLRPRGVGDILDETIRIYRRNFVTMIGIVAIVVVPFSIVQFAFGLWWNAYGVESFSSFDFGDTASAIRLILQLSLIFFVALVYLFLISALVPGALARVTAGDVIGPPVGLGRSYRLGWRSIWSLSWAQLMVGTLYAALLVVFLTCIGVPVAVPALAFFATRWAFVLHCCVLEKNRTIAALERSWRLVNNQFWHSLLVLTLLYIFAGVVMVILPGAFNFALTLSPPLPVALTTATNAMLNAATAIFVLPVVVVGMTVLYYDLRVRRDGLDLVIALTELEEAQGRQGRGGKAGGGSLIDVRMVLRLIKKRVELRTSPKPGGWARTPWRIKAIYRLHPVQLTARLCQGNDRRQRPVCVGHDPNAQPHNEVRPRVAVHLWGGTDLTPIPSPTRRGEQEVPFSGTGKRSRPFPFPRSEWEQEVPPSRAGKGARGLGPPINVAAIRQTATKGLWALVLVALLGLTFSHVSKSALGAPFLESSDQAQAPRPTPARFVVWESAGSYRQIPKPQMITFRAAGATNIRESAFGAVWPKAEENAIQQAAAAPATPLEEYEKVLRLALRQIESARTANENIRGVYLDQAVRQLQSVSAVELAGGTQMPVDNQWLIGELRRPQPDLEGCAARLRVLIEELHDVRTSQPQWSKDPEAALQSVLAQNQYQWDKPPRKSPFDSLLDPLRKWLNDLREKILEWLRQHIPEQIVDFSPGSSGLTTISWWVYALGGGVVLVFIVFIGWNLRRRTKRRAVIPQQTALNEDEITTTTDAFAAANQLASRGDYRSGIRALYLAALLHLHERELLKYDRTLTNREHLREVRSNRRVYDQLVPLVTTFDRVWYGQINPTAEEFEKFHHGVEGLRQVAG